MEPAHLGVIVDSSIMIEAERQRLDVARFLKLVTGRIGDRAAALCAISVAELAHGVHRAGTLERRQARRAFLDDLLIGACALERSYAIATRNQRHFQMIPGLKLISF